MEWVNLNPMILSTFGSLRVQEDETIATENDRVEVLQDIYNKLWFEDRTTRPFRRAIGFTQVVKKDLLPLLINTKNDTPTFDLCIKILMNLTIPVECLLPIDSLCKTDEGRNTIYELNWLLTSCKEAFLESKTTRCIIEHIKKFTDNESEAHVTSKTCDCINNCLILLRNILHIPEVRGGVTTSHHNQILWNLFTHGFDKVLIQLITQHEKHKLWSISVVQLIALMYKDQHVNTLQKLLNLWFETSPSEEDSSEDNESNTSPPNPGMDSYSFTLTSDPNSNDSSDISGSEKDKDKEKEEEASNPSSPEHGNRRITKPASPPTSTEEDDKMFTSMINVESKIIRAAQNAAGDTGGSVSADSQYVSGSEKETTGSKDQYEYMSSSASQERGRVKLKRKADTVGKTTTDSEGGNNGVVTSEDCGYGTQHHESISTSSNEDDGIPIHQKPVNLIQKARPISGKSLLTAQEKKESRRKKLIKRSHTNTNMKALLHHTPSEDDIAHLLKEFTVDFLLKGYGRLVSQLNDLLVTGFHSQIDTSHFFWLITYFLKFVVQLELDIDHVSSVISFDILSYLTFEGVNLCEQLQIVKLHKDINFDPYVRRIHLVVTSIKEILHTIQVYYSAGKNAFLDNLTTQMCRSENVRCMMILLIRQYDPIQGIQYLQDLIVTNHMLLMLLETGSRNSNVKFDMIQHLQQFTNKEVMYNYGVLLENFDDNGEFANNSIFTMMHHVGGDLTQLSSLFQPHILKSFSKMWETDYDLRDDWSDLIEYTIHQYINIKKPQAALPQNQNSSNGTNNGDGSEWSVDDSNNLYWFYVQNAKSSDPVGAVIKLYIQNGVLNKTRQGVVQQLLIQDVISDGQYMKMMIKENMIEQQTSKPSGGDTKTQNSGVSNNRKELTNTENDETGVLRDHLIKEKKSGDLLWLQRNLLEACAAKLYNEQKIDCFIEPVPYHSVRMSLSISLVPYNTEQASAMLYQPFMLLLHKLGLHLPADAGKIYARIPSFMTADMLYAMAEKLGPINPAYLKFEPSLVETKSSSPSSLSSSVDFPTFGPGCSYRSEPFKERVNHSAEWIDIVNKAKNVSAPDDIADTISESTDSDLNRMYVSDEEFAASKATSSTLPKVKEDVEKESLFMELDLE
uniref:Protein timeless n=1 Tax=Cacopsylla melanoneura TaxID=428564 RepID=A0A8D8UQR2_9HEMI